MVLIAVYIIFVVSFFGNLFVENHIFPAHFTLLAEALIYFIFLYSLLTSKRNARKFHWHLFYTFLFVALIACYSIAINLHFNIQIILSFRIFWRFFIFYLAIINIGFEETDFKKINRFISVLLILQIPIVVAQFIMHGGIAERNFGSFYEGGAVSTIYPVTAIMYLMGYFAFFKAKLIYLLLGAGFIVWSILGAKKAVFFLFPLGFMGMYYYIYIKGKSLGLVKHIANLGLIIVLIIVTSFFILKYNRQLNPDRIVGGKADFKYAFEYGMEQSIRVDPDNPDVATGRLSTLVFAFSYLKDGGFGKFLFGYGPGVLTQSIIYNQNDPRLITFKLGYGMTPLTKIALEYGVLGIIFYGLIIITFLRMCLKYYSIETDPYWKAFAAGSLGLAFFMIFLFCFYNTISINGDSFPLFYFYIMGVIFVRLNIASHSPNPQSSVD
jgi:hypothetical protein